MKFTINDFRRKYPNDDVCLDKIFQLRYGDLTNCLKCGCETKFYRVQTKSYVHREKRKCYECSHCGYQLYPLAGTIFEKTRTPLTSWFYAIYLFTATRNGVAAKELERQLGVTYKCAWRMAHQIRLLMAASKNGANPLTGVVEMDETYVGGVIGNKSKKERLENKLNKKNATTGHMNKIPVFGIVEHGGRVFLKVMDGDSVNGETLTPIINEKVSKDAIVVTDGHSAYKDLKKTFPVHYSINHSGNEYMRDGFHTNTIEGFWSQLKRTIKGTHIMVSRKHLQKYADEVAFRYENRNRQAIMFEIILSQVC